MLARKPNSVRIIAGKYKHKILPVLDLEGLRPTPDLVRETLFNWLGDKVKNAVVLDLFAGSGALGFEAISRGASVLYLVEKEPSAAAKLKTFVPSFNEDIRVFNQTAESFLQETTTKFDLVFLDPPYASNLLHLCLPLLLAKNLIKDDSLLYVEMQTGSNTVIPGYRILRELTQGQVKYALWQKNSLW